jgi:hypothetical protein
MTINELIDRLRCAEPDARVRFSFCGCVPTTVGSWRGIYAEPAIGWQPADYSGYVKDYPTASSLIAELERSIDGRSYIGWKGGEYRYTGDQTLHVDNYGDYTKTEIYQVVAIDSDVVMYTDEEQ